MTGSLGHTYSLVALIVLCLLGSAASPAPKADSGGVFPADCWGVYSWCSWNTQKVTRERCPLIKGAPIVLHWNKVEPECGVFAFDKQLKEKLVLARAQGFYTFVMIWVAPRAPRWLYERGVPELEMTATMSPFRKPRDWTFQYYLDEDYKRYYHRLIRTFGQYIRDLPAELRERILYVQSAEGSTGDGFCYKGEPLDKRYGITREQWARFRIEAWDVFKAALTDKRGLMAKPLLVNYDANREGEYEWLLQNLDTIGLKNGMFSHGYHISDTRRRLENWHGFIDDVERAGKRFFSRGEQDGEWQVCGWSRRNTQQALYWSAIFAAHCGLDMWNLPQEACQGEVFSRAINFFNKYAGQHDASKSPAAFCALRKGLDASDTLAYPEGTYGKAGKSNVERYLRIAERFKRFGAIQGDPEKATGGGMKNRQRDNYNDVGWGIVAGNYFRFLRQVDAEGTSVGWWHVGPEESIFSRFARGFDRKKGKGAMYFKLDSAFFGGAGQQQSARARIVYLDRGEGLWEFVYNRNGTETSGCKVKCRNSGMWREKTVMLNQALFTGSLERGADLVLRHLGGDDTIFHLVELERL